MEGIGHFTLPVGRDPKTASNVSICTLSEWVEEVLDTMDSEGQYQLYQCIDNNGVPANIVPVCRVRKPLLLNAPAVYLDTSAVSYLVQEDAPEEMAITLKFWEAAKSHKLSLYLSDVTLEELTRCPEPRRTSMFDLLNEVSYTLIESTGSPQVRVIAQEIAGMGILPRRSTADISHIAAAIHARCDVIASWNFKHLVNQSTVEGVRTVALLNGCGSIDIQSPKNILEVYL